ncbi:MAG: UvrB/UvrC motif-containing protein, partial [Dehalococcoidia bacterium]
QTAHNEEHGITPQGIKKAVKDITDRIKAVAETRVEYVIPKGAMPRDEILRLIKDLEYQMKQAAQNLEFEKAAMLRDQIIDLRKAMALDEDAKIEQSVGHKTVRASRVQRPWK